MNKNVITTTTISLEPTWEYICRTTKNPFDLLPACKIADMVRQAQKSGCKSLVFTFTEEGVSVEEQK